MPGSQVRACFLPVSCSIVRHKPAARGPLDANKARPSLLELPPVTSDPMSQVRHSAGACLSNVTRHLEIRNRYDSGSSHVGQYLIFAGNSHVSQLAWPEASIRSVTIGGSRPSIGTLRPLHSRVSTAFTLVESVPVRGGVTTDGDAPVAMAQRFPSRAGRPKCSWPRIKKFASRTSRACRDLTRLVL